MATSKTVTLATGVSYATAGTTITGHNTSQPQHGKVAWQPIGRTPQQFAVPQNATASHGTYKLFANPNGKGWVVTYTANTPAAAPRAPRKAAAKPTAKRQPTSRKAG
jgi:hypothetical protein